MKAIKERIYKVKPVKSNPVVDHARADDGGPYSRPGSTAPLTRGEEDTLLQLLRARLDDRSISCFESLLLLKIVRARADRMKFEDKYPAGKPCPVKANMTSRKLLMKEASDGKAKV